MGEQLVTKEEAKKQEESPAAPEAAPASAEEKKDEAAPAPAEEKKDEAAPAPAEEKKDEAASAPAEEKKDEAAPPPVDQDKPKEEPPAPASPPPPVPVILGVEVHCTGCAKRIKRSLLRCKGVEAVDVHMPANQVTIKGAVDPQALCARLRAKTKREATLISPLPPPPPAEGEEPAPPPPPAPPLVSEARTVELLVNMHCEACAQQLQSKMMRMKGVVSAETDLAAGRLTLSATVDDEKIVEYIHRRTGKLASVVPPEPPKEEEPPAPAADGETPKEEAPADADGKKEDAGENKPAEDGKGAAEAGEEKKEGGGGAGEEDQKPGKQEGVAVDGFPPEEMMKRMVYWPYGGAPGGGIHYKLHPADAEEAMMARRMAMHATPPHHHHHHHQHNPYAMMQHQWVPPPPPPPPGMPMYNNYNYGSSYMMERPPQMFSDENPNACVIS